MSDMGNTIKMLKTSLDRVDRGKPVKVYYRSNRGNKSMKTVSGEIVNVDWLSNDTANIWFYNESDEKKYCVVVDESLNDSVMKSQKTTTATTIGNAVRVLVPNENCSIDELEQEHVFEKREGEYETVIAAAKIKHNETVIQYLNNER